jgi:hypothetical protein
MNGSVPLALDASRAEWALSHECLDAPTLDCRWSLSRPHLVNARGVPVEPFLDLATFSRKKHSLLVIEIRLQINRRENLQTSTCLYRP